ncbi:trypsin-like serine protease [uncultured Enterovirga sp.]|uniref:trypsin-like serine protease n=1 Tax=uncultured Enterovirga sp. TaxID=2026352 RepID=UPI0035CB8D17
MSPDMIDAVPRRPAPAVPRAVGRILALALALAPVRAGAVVGGSDDQGPLSRTTVMVLNSRGGVCSGIVVAQDAILTAAHCATGTDQYRIHLPGGGGSPILIEPSAITVHPGYDRGAAKARRRSIDLALIRTATALPAGFSAATLTTAFPAKGAAVSLGGYGVSREGDPRSTGTFRTAALAAVEPYGPGRILLWAASSGGGASGACEGDSGGPIASAGGAVAAVSTWATGRGRARCGEMSQGVLVAPQRAWIDRTLSGWGRAASWE